MESYRDPIDTTLFLIPPDDKFLCCNHGGLMSCPVVNIECGHLFCPICIETLVQCPIDHMVIKTLDINFQLKNELDQLLCYCKFGVEEVDGMLTVRPDGCGSIISFGSKQTHEESCRYNPANQIFSTTSSDSEFVEFDRINRSTGLESPQLSSPFVSFESSSTLSSPFSTCCSDNSNHSFSILKKEDHIDISGSNSSSSMRSNPSSYSSINSNVVVGNNTPKSNTPKLNDVSSGGSDNNNNDEKNEMWESSTNLFYSSSRFCPNKEHGCYFYGKSDENINYHLEHECQAQRMKNRINQLENMIEKKDAELHTIKSSYGIDDSGKKLVTRSVIGDIIYFIFSGIKKRVSKGFKKIKKIFFSKSYKRL